jgi:hypothetical protein
MFILLVQSRADVTRRVRTRELLALRLDPREGMARRKAQTFGIRVSFWESRRAPLGAPHALILVRYRASRYLSARLGWLPRFARLERMAQLRRTQGACSFCGDLANTGPRFLSGRSRQSRGPERASAQGGRRPVAQTPKSSASSWRGLVVVPGGAPAPPECRLCVSRPAGRRTSSRLQRRLATAPLNG